MLERMTHNTYPISDREKRNALLAKEAATQSMVLLKNENKALPLAEESTIAMFGVGAVRTVRGGTGSGDPFNGGLSGGGDLDVDQSTRYHIQILDSMVNHGMNVLNADALREQNRLLRKRTHFGYRFAQLSARSRSLCQREWC